LPAHMNSILHLLSACNESRTCADETSIIHTVTTAPQITDTGNHWYTTHRYTIVGYTDPHAPQRTPQAPCAAQVPTARRPPLSRTSPRHPHNWRPTIVTASLHNLALSWHEARNAPHGAPCMEPPAYIRAYSGVKYPQVLLSARVRL